MRREARQILLHVRPHVKPPTWHSERYSLLLGSERSKAYDGDRQPLRTRSGGE